MKEFTATEFQRKPGALLGEVHINKLAKIVSRDRPAMVVMKEEDYERLMKRAIAKAKK